MGKVEVGKAHGETAKRFSVRFRNKIEGFDTAAEVRKFISSSPERYGYSEIYDRRKKIDKTELKD
jgi:hypothetical protein